MRRLKAQHQQQQQQQQQQKQTNKHSSKQYAIKKYYEGTQEWK